MDGTPARTCRHFGISRETFYRWLRRFDRHDLHTLEARSHRAHKVRHPSWTAALAERVLALRKQYPCWGKDKLVVLLAREKLLVSVSMVGRILSALKRTGALHEPPKPTLLLRQHRKLRKRPWATRKPKYWPIEHPGDLVEINKEIRMHRGVLLKHFSARDVISRWDVVEVHRRGTSLAAARFLDTLLERFPFSVSALQVDGGSEFAAEFELACQQKQLPLFVLRRSPRSSTPTSSARTAPTMKSSTKYTRTRTSHHGSITSYASGSIPTTACARTSRWPTSPHWNSSLDGNRTAERQSVTNLLDEYTV